MTESMTMESRKNAVLHVVLTLIFVCGSASARIADGSFLFTAPDKLKLGSSDNSFCLTFHNFPGTKYVHITVEARIAGVDVVDIMKNITADHECFDHEIPDLPLSADEQHVAFVLVQIYHATANGRLVAAFDEQTYETELHVVAAGNRLQTFIQTDKPIYKAGQTVKFRVLTLNDQLKPYTGKIKKVYIEEPGGRRMQQWRHIDTQAGLVDMKFELSSEPPLGNWSIYVNVGEEIRKVKQTFEVNEYVLPKFSVSIVPTPDYVYKTTNQITVKVCGEYSYGEPVRGAIEANISLSSNDPSYRNQDIITRTIPDTGSDGCHTFGVDDLRVLNLEDVFQRRKDGRCKLNITATFTESGTGETMTESGDVELTRTLYKLEIDGPNTFKPGLPYHGQVRLTYPNNQPVRNKNVEVTVTNLEGGGEFRWFTNTHIANGQAQFQLSTPRDAANTKIQLTAKVVADEGTPNSDEITTNKLVDAFFSASGSFLSITPISGTQQAGQQCNVNVEFMDPAEEQTIMFYYRIVSKDKTHDAGQKTWRRPATSRPVLPVDPRPRRPILPVDPHPQRPRLPVDPHPQRPRLPVDPQPQKPRLLVDPHSQKPRLSVVPRPGPEPGPDLRVEPKQHIPGFQRISQGPQRPVRGRMKRWLRPTMSDTNVQNLEPTNLPEYQNLEIHSISIPFTVTPQMGPESRVIVYYYRRDREVVADIAEFKVNTFFDNQVSLEFSSAEARPGASIQLTVNASPQSLCALGVVDKSVHLLRDSNQLTAQKVISRSPVQSFGYQLPTASSGVCSTDNYQYATEINSGRITKLSRHIDTYDVFLSQGLTLSNNWDNQFKPCYVKKYKRLYYSRMETPRGGLHGPMGSNIGPRIQVLDDQIMLHTVAFNHMELETDNILPQDDILSPLVKIRSYFPETWLWLLTVTSDSGTASVDSEVPHTITNWVANGFCTSSEDGIGIADPVELRAFQPFFLSYNLPFSAIREEKVPIDVTVFNYLTECFTIELTIDDSTEFSLLDQTRNKYVCVCDRESKTVNYTIIPRKLGEIKITVHGSYVTPGFPANIPSCGNDIHLPNVVGVRDAIEDTLLIEPEGVEREETFSQLFCVEPGQDATVTVPLIPPTDVIPDSARGRVYVTGDLMGSVLANLDGILQMPTGCGEQNMIKFAPNIYVLQYLTSTDQLTKDVEEKALNFLRIGYQRELTYRLSDGSYSAFGENDEEGSTWLTAFVLKSYVQANRFIDIDESDIDVTKNWLLRQQLEKNGCFEKRGILRHQSMKGGVSDEVTLTAYVMVALLEAGYNRTNTEILGATRCITARLSEVYHDPYGLALVTYALQLTGHPRGSEALQQLDALSRVESGGLQHWKRTDDELDTADCLYCKEPSASVEMTSYGLLAYLVSDDKDAGDARPIVRWLNTQRSALGGYSSTQDTVMGLQSLAAYASQVYRNSTNMAIDMTQVGTNTFLKRFVVHPGNQILSQRWELDEVPTTLSFSATGDGCALVQAELRYNVPAVRTIRRDSFNITLDISPPDSVEHCGKKTLTTCVRYIGPWESTSMAAVEFKMVTGYSVDMESLALYLQKHGQSIGLKRVDPPSKGQPLVLYFDKFDSDERCFEVTVKQNVFVDSAKPASIKVYDYYDPGIKAYKEYNTCPPKEEQQNQG